jgi:hypothetical protein
MKDVTEITIHEDGEETHESWILVRAGKVSSTGTRLFDSDIAHRSFVRVSVSRCRRKRDLNQDRKHEAELLMEFDMSQAQWGAFVSSFGIGTGVPATLAWDRGSVPSAPPESRLQESHRETREAAQKAFEEIRELQKALEDAFNDGAGRRELRERLHQLRMRVENAPANVEFASRALSEHVENVITKARADIEGMIAMSRAGETPAFLTTEDVPEITTGEEEE